MYDAPPFIPPPSNKFNTAIHKAVRNVRLEGVEFWQLNLKMTSNYVELLSIFPLEMFTTIPTTESAERLRKGKARRREDDDILDTMRPKKKARLMDE
jgi:hypothetical protein